MEYASDNGNSWRRDIETWLRENLFHQVFNPVAETEKFLARYYPNVSIRALKTSSPGEFKEIMGKIVERDLNAIEKCDYVICLWDESSRKGAGTSGEITLAKFLNKPIFIVSRFDLSQIPSWIIGCADRIFKDFDELKVFLLSKFKLSDAADKSRD